MCYYGDCDQDHKINTIRSVVLKYNSTSSNKYRIGWSTQGRLLALVIIDIELYNHITCTDEHKLDLFIFDGISYKIVNKELVEMILTVNKFEGGFTGTAESVWWRLI